MVVKCTVLCSCRSSGVEWVFNLVTIIRFLNVAIRITRDTPLPAGGRARRTTMLDGRENAHPIDRMIDRRVDAPGLAGTWKGAVGSHPRSRECMPEGAGSSLSVARSVRRVPRQPTTATTSGHRYRDRYHRYHRWQETRVPQCASHVDPHATRPVILSPVFR